MFSFAEYIADKFPLRNQRALMDAAYAWCLANPHKRLSLFVHSLEKEGK